MASLLALLASSVACPANGLELDPAALRPRGSAASVASASASRTDPWPPDTGLINVRTDAHCALAGDGRTDDTAALQSCIEYWADHNTLGGFSKQAPDMLFFPDGTYQLSDRISWIGADQGERSYLGFWGQSRDGVVFQLADASPGFDDPSQPKAVFHVGSGTRGGAFENNLRSFTLRIGGGNPGAIGVDYIGNNVVDVRDLKIEAPSGECLAGLYNGRKWSGPVLFKNIEVSGCRYGLWIGFYHSGITAENITVRNQTGAGVWIDRQVVSLRNLVSEQDSDVPALLVTNSSDGSGGPLVVLLGAVLSGPAEKAASSAIEVMPAQLRSTDPRVLLRDVHSRGYLHVLDDRGRAVGGSDLSEYHSHSVTSVFPSIEETLRLPFPEHPHMVHPDLADWRSITADGAVPNDGEDDLAAIQQAIDSGKKVVYCPKGGWEISGTIVLRGRLERLVGYDCQIVPHGSGARISPVFLIDESLDHDVEIDGIRLVRKGGRSREFFANPRTVHRSRHALIATNAAHLTRYEAVPGAGDFYAENIGFDGIWLSGNRLYCRQCDIETPDLPKLWVRGGGAAILGLKTEYEGTPMVRAEGGAQVEILAAHHLGVGDPKVITAGPLYEIHDSDFSIAYVTMINAAYDPQVTVTRKTHSGDEAASLPREAVDRRSAGAVNLLFVERPRRTNSAD